MPKKYNNTLDFLKGVGCMGVVLIHFPFPGMFGLIIKRICFSAVPIFFLTSGYFSYNKDEEIQRINIARKSIGILKISVWSIAFYFLYSLLFHLVRQDVAVFLSKCVGLDAFIDFCIINNFENIDGYHLWFLPSLLYSYIILLVLDKFRYINKTHKALPFLFVLKLLVEVIAESYGLSYHLRCNVIIGALPYVLLGRYFAYTHIEKSKVGTGISALAFISCIVIALLTLWNRQCGLWWVMVACISVLLFVIAVKNPTMDSFKFIQKIGKDYSLYVYVFHVFVYRIVSNLAIIAGLMDYEIMNWLIPSLTVISSVLGAVMLNSMKKYLHRLNRIGLS